MANDRVREDAAKADQMIAELAKGAEPEAPEGVIAEADASTDEGVGLSTDGGAPDPSTDAGSAAIGEFAPDADALRREAALWEQRYRSLDGMIQGRDRQIEQLHQLIAGMQAPQQVATPPAAAPESHLTAKDDEAFGADLVDMARRAARAEQAREADALRKEIESLKQQLGGVAQTAAVSHKAHFEQQLTQAFPDWRAVDADPNFLLWLEEVPTRARLFGEAASARDVAGVAYMFQDYARQHAPQAKPADAPAKKAPKLEHMVAPGKSRAAAPPAQHGDKKQWTASEIAAFYRDGKKRFAQDEYTRLEKDVFAAQREGRVDFSK